MNPFSGFDLTPFLLKPVRTLVEQTFVGHLSDCRFMIQIIVLEKRVLPCAWICVTDNCIARGVA